MPYTFPTEITLAEFEDVDAAYGRLLRASPAKEACMESRLFGALVRALGFMEANDIADVRDYAGHFVTRCLTGAIAVDDAELESDWDGFDGWGVNPEAGRGEYVA